MLIKINKKEARKAFKQGFDVYMCPTRALPTCKFATSINRWEFTASFDELVNDYRYNNPNYNIWLGNRVNYYVDTPAWD